MKMEALGSGRVERIVMRTGTGAAGQEWEDRAMMVPLNGQKLYVIASLSILTDNSLIPCSFFFTMWLLL